MAWTDQKTMGHEPTLYSDWNTHVRDNLNYLKTKLEALLIGTTPAAIADDTAISFAPTNPYGAVLIISHDGEVNASGLFDYHVATTAYCSKICGGSVNTSTSILTGTTGTDGYMTVSANENGNIYIENRRGGARTINYLLVGS